MYAIICTGGKQYRVSPQEIVTVEKLPAAPGERVVFDRVALVEHGGQVEVGTPWVSGAKVVGTVLGEIRGPKIEVFTYKAKDNVKRTLGHRQRYLRVRVDEIVAGGEAQTGQSAVTGTEEKHNGS